MRKRIVIIALTATAFWIMLAAWLISSYKPDAAIQRATQVITEETPEQRLIGIWLQTQEYLDYENQNIHSDNVTVADKGRLEFRDDGTCKAEHPYMETIVFSYEYKDGEVILTAEGWAPLRYLLDGNALIDPETDIGKYEKQ